VKIWLVLWLVGILDLLQQNRAVPIVYVISVAPHDNFFLIPREDQFPDHLAYLLLAQVEAIELDYYNGISKYKSD